MILGVLQARTSSRRLPGKVLMPLLGTPMLVRQIERLKRALRIDQLIVATSDEVGDEKVAELAGQAGIACYRGSLGDVLDRFYQAALPYSPSHVVRLTGDCPLADWEIIDQAIELAVMGGYDIAGNGIKRTFPDGLDVEVVRFDALTTAWQSATEPGHREHVTQFLYQNPNRFRIGHLTQPLDLSEFRWTVDEPADFVFATRVFEALYPIDNTFRMNDVLAFLRQNPDVVAINAGIVGPDAIVRVSKILHQGRLP